MVQIPAMPSYIERMLLDKLKRKLLDEYGEPAPPPPPPDPTPEEPAEPPSSEPDN